MTNLTLAMPTTDSATVIGETLDCAARAAEAAEVDIHLQIVDDDSDDRTTEIARERASAHGWPVRIESAGASLPVARQRLIDGCETEWLWFVDDDVRVDEEYLQRLRNVIGPDTGAVQGRKHKRSDESATDWLQYRARRGGTHATLIRRAAVADISIPADLHVLEDEYIRRRVEKSGYAWQFHPHAYFEHNNQDRHAVGYQEGYLGGKYGLSRGLWMGLNVPFALLTGRDTIAHARQLAGWVAGYRARRQRNGASSTEVAEA